MPPILIALCGKSSSMARTFAEYIAPEYESASSPYFYKILN
jgi:hypothetical protein